MINVDEALRMVLECVNSLDAETVEISDSLGRVISEDVYSDCNIPAFDYSAMDGYALKYSDTRGASPESPKALRVIGELRAGGSVLLKIENGQAVKIMTGAPIPEGADAVLMVEHTRGEGSDVLIFEEVENGENIRRVGEDIKRGDFVIQKGTSLREAHVGMLAALGISKVKVTKKPSVAILATGDEVINIDGKMEPGKVRNSNAYSLSSQVVTAGGIPVNKGIARDEPDELRTKLRACLECDVIITSGGVSMGEYDLVKNTLVELGMEQKFWKVAVRPGKPNLFGVIHGKPVFGLPGNPVSSMVGFEIFVRPAILKMLNQSDDPKKEIEAVLEEDIRKKKGLRLFIRAQTRWEDGLYRTKTTGPQGSGILSSMVLANSLIILPEDEEFVEKGRRVRVRFI